MRRWLVAATWVGGVVAGQCAGGAGVAVALAVVGAAFAVWSVRDAARKPTAAAIAIAETEGWQARALTATLAAAEDGLLVLDREDRVLACNQTASRLARLGEPAGTRRTLHEVLDWPQLTAALATARAQMTTSEFEAERGDGDAALTVAASVTVDPGTGLAVVVLQDLSRLRRLESHRRDFVANVSHELKTPLAAIQGFVETLLDDPDAPVATRQRFLQRALKQAQNLATLVSDLLTLSRLDERGPEPADPHDFTALVGEVVRDLQPFADKRSVALQASLPECHLWVAAERETLRQIASNLVDNAIKYTPTGGSVTVTLRRVGANSELEVRDTGIGLSEPDQQRVFERFYRVDKARSRELGGTGLGLSIVKHIVLGLGGEIGVRSRLGQGSTFWVRLPTEAIDTDG